VPSFVPLDALIRIEDFRCAVAVIGVQINLYLHLHIWKMLVSKATCIAFKLYIWSVHAFPGNWTIWAAGMYQQQHAFVWLSEKL